MPRRIVVALVVPALALLAAASGGFAAGEKSGETSPVGGGRRGVVRAPGWDPLGYPAPEPGTYELPSLGTAADGAVLDTTGTPHRLYDFLGDKVAVLSFVYTSCPDVNACPLAGHVLAGVQRRIAEDPTLAERVRLVTMSFDPEHDTPEVMRRYASRLARDGVEWQFLTTTSEASLQPILEAYGQSVNREHDADGRPLGTISHVLRVYLIDRERRIRNLYTTSFLHADTVWSDIRTVLMDAAGDARGPRASSDGARGGGRPVDLLELFRGAPLGLPPPPRSPDAPMTREAIALGRKLFFDRRLSHNDTISCAMCHIPEQGFTSNEMATAVGIEGRTVRRNAPTIYNVAFATPLFHDGREDRLEQQIWGPLLAFNEMGNPSVGWVLDRLRRLPDYAGLFEAAFDGRGPTMETLGAALASYQRTLMSAASPFDRWYFGKEAGALPAAAERGFALFTGRARCASCHVIADTHALFTDGAFHNTGIGYRQTEEAGETPRRVQVAPGVFIDVDPAVVAASSERRPSDLGRYEVTRDPDDRWKYRTPTLRNVALTAPYMHDGSLPTLRDVVVFYDRGGVANELLDPMIRPLGLQEGEIEDLVAFLSSLTGDNVDAIVEDALDAPIGDPG